MPAEGLPQRIERAIGAEALRRALAEEAGGANGALDPADARHVDAASHELLKRVIRDGDSDALSLLVELCQAKLEDAAEEVAARLGLAMPADELIVALFSTLFVDLPPGTEPPRHFLAWATDWMERAAEAWIRDLALLDGPRPGSRRLPPQPMPDGTVTRTPDETEGDLYAYLVKIAFHRLDVESRRILRAVDVQALPLSQAASQLGLDTEGARRRLDAARSSLNAAVARLLMNGADS